ncbi:MAG TPA: SDR family oxidoreductase [Tepidisphaeraceae bacterium]|nr:SDR family oxidoreductase [Tepidisphaeraceae bacterium]
MRLQHKISVVTGAAQGIGRAMALRFAEEGAAVLVADIDEQAGEETAAEIRKEGRPASFVRCDVSVAAQVEHVAKLAGDRAGRIDVVVNNAAVLGPWHDVASVTEAEWDAYYRVSLLGASMLIKAALPYMLPHRSGSIINVASVQGMVGARSSIAYTSVKHGLIGLTRSVAYDYGPHNIRCNAICPGAIRTRISPQPGSEQHERQVGKTMLGRTGEPIEVAHAAVFLASDEASYITGAVLPVDGGWTAM